jgi:hypothetical protein
MQRRFVNIYYVYWSFSDSTSEEAQKPVLTTLTNKTYTWRKKNSLEDDICV